MFELLCLLGDLFLQRRLTLGEPVLQLRLTLGELRLELGLTLGELRLQLGLALVGGAAQLGHAGRGFPGERFLALGEQALRLRLVLLELGLELLTGRADARFEFGLALHQVGGVRCLQAVDLGARDAQFLAEDARLLLLGPQDAELVADVDQLARRVREFGLRGLRRLAGVERLDVGRVQVLLHLLGTLCVRLQRVELATGQRQLGLRALELRPEPDRFLLDLARLAIGFRIALGLRHFRGFRLFRDVARELVPLRAHRRQLSLEQSRLTLGLQQPRLDLGVGTGRRRRRRAFLEHPLRDMELFERLAVLLLDDGQPLLCGGGALLCLPAGLGLLAEPRRRQLQRALRRDLRREPRRDAVPDRGRETGVRRCRRAEPHDPVEDEQRDDEAERHEDRVVAPWPAGRGDQVVGTGELDGGADRSVAPEPQGDEHGEHAIALLG